jgi:autotransporter-associated beta strand protein
VDVTVTDPGGTSATSPADQFTYTVPLVVLSADWTTAGLTLTLGSDGNVHVYTTGTTSDVVPPAAPASVANIQIASPSNTSVNLTIDSSNGDPVPAAGLMYSGAGGLIVTGSGSVTLSGASTYTGGTTVSSGTLIETSPSALPGGTILTIGAGGTFIFDPTMAGSNIAAASQAARGPSAARADRTAEPAASGAHPSLKAWGGTSMGSFAASVLAPSRRASVPAIASLLLGAGAKQSRGAARASAALIRQVGSPLVDPILAERFAAQTASLAASPNPSWPAYQGQDSKVSVEALDAVLAQYGV